MTMGVLEGIGGSTLELDDGTRSVLKNFLDSLSDPVLILDRDARLVGFNEAARGANLPIVFDSKDFLPGENYFDLFETNLDDSIEELRDQFQKVLSGDQERDEIHFPTPDREYSLLMNVLPGTERRFVALVHQNVSSASTSNQKEKSRLLKELQATTRKLMKTETVEDVARIATEIASDYFDFATVGVRLLKDGKLRMVIDRKEDERLEGRMPPAYEPGEGFVGQAFVDGDPVIHDDLVSVSEDCPFDYSPMRSAMLLPLGEFGIIGAASDEPGAFDELDRELGQQFAADVESAMKRAQREETLRQREEELRRTTVGHNYLLNLMDTLPAGLCIMNSDDVIKRTNQSMCSLLDYQEDELIGEHGRVLFEKAQDELRRIRESLSDRGHPWHEEIELVNQQDESVPVQLSASVLVNNRSDREELVLAAIDIRPRRKKSEELYDSRRRLSLALNVARAGVWEWNIKSGEEYWDSNTERLFGLEPGEFEGTYEDFLKRVHPDHREELDKAANQAIETKSDYEKEFRIRSDGSDPRWLMSRGEIFTDTEGNPETMLGVTMDITERKNTQKALEQSIEEKESLLKEIHHRVKNNMQIINSFLSMQNRNIESEEVDRAFRESMSRVRAMAMIHEKLYQSTDLTDVNFEHYLRDLINHLTESTGKSDTVCFQVSIDEGELDLDRAIACGLIVNELVTNSLQHGLSEPEENQITVEFRQSGSDEYYLQVRDEGSGFPENFDPDTSGSTGLDIVRSLVDFELEGSLQFENDNGAKVTMTF